MSQKTNNHSSHDFSLLSDYIFEKSTTLGFFAREKPPIFTQEEIEEFNKKLETLDETPVEILRHVMFFHTEQKGITLGKLKEFFSDKAIKLFDKDGYIKIQYNK